MTPSLRDLQRRFAASLLAADPPSAGVGVYRDTVRSNYRNAMAATYRVVRELTGRAFFDTAVDAFVAAHPPAGGDLNVYGGDLATFLAGYPYGQNVAYLSDVARLEWAMDEATRAADPALGADATIAGLSTLDPEQLLRRRLVLEASCRLLRSAFPVLRIWQAHQAGSGGDFDIDFNVPAEHLLVRREGASPVVERLAPAEYQWLAALGAGDTLGVALDRAFACNAQFNAGAALGKHIANGAIHAR